MVSVKILAFIIYDSSTIVMIIYWRKIYIFYISRLTPSDTSYEINNNIYFVVCYSFDCVKCIVTKT